MRKAFDKKNSGMNATEEGVFNLVRGMGFRFMGQSRACVGNKRPDFVNFKKRLIIEVFGEHVHPLSDVGKRTRYFAKFGYRTLVIWGREVFLRGIFPRVGLRGKIHDFYQNFKK